MFAFQPVWVTAAVPLFVMLMGNGKGGAQIVNGRQHFIRIDRMLLHDVPFFLGQFIRLKEYRIRDAHFAYIVQERAAADVFHY